MWYEQNALLCIDSETIREDTCLLPCPLIGKEERKSQNIFGISSETDTFQLVVGVTVHCED